ncbi:carbohydrate-binding protein [Paenibacillus sp. GCM10023252]|uniref:carbohydrate-binding protein n=1 Tax=Paenibacillus sp. GCM10023252 TaxID=3252649 RepID=UPI003613E421
MSIGLRLPRKRLKRGIHLLLVVQMILSSISLGWLGGGTVMAEPAQAAVAATAVEPAPTQPSAAAAAEVEPAPTQPSAAAAAEVEPPGDALAGTGSSASAPAERTAAAAGVTELFVATTGSDTTGDGSMDRPYATVQKAKEVVRELTSAMTSDITVQLRGGKYYQDSRLSWNEEDSGRNGHQVIYKSYVGETAEIVGGKPITGWTLDSGTGSNAIYRADVGTGAAPFYTLFENGVRAVMARTPNAGYLHAQASTSKATQITYQEGELPEGAEADYTNAQVFDWPGDEAWWNWSSETRAVLGLDPGTNTITLEQGGLASGWQVQTGARYYVQGAKVLLDEPGEFYLDEQAGQLYYWPRHADIDQQEIVASADERLIELRGSAESSPVHDIVFEGLLIRGSDFSKNSSPTKNEPTEGLIYLENANQIELRGNRILGAGHAGIMLFHAAQHNRIEGNWIEDSGTFGIGLFGWALGEGGYSSAAESYVNKFNTITNNYIHHFGRLLGHGSGIQLFMSGDNDISHNEISKGPRYGISIKGANGAWFYGQTKYGAEVTEANFESYNHSRNNRIAFNDISDVMKDTADGGAFESWCPGTGNLIDNNRIHDIYNLLGDKIMGIYLDDNSSHFKVTNNIIYGIHSVEVWPMTIKGTNNEVSNNIIADSDGVVDIYTGDLSKELIFTRNIMYRPRPKSYNVYFSYQWSLDKIAQSDYNLIYHQGGGTTFRTDRFLDAAEWKALSGGKYDQHSLIGADPMFQNAEQHDYTLKAGSPALQLGFVNINQSDIGLLDSFPWDVPEPDYPAIPEEPATPGKVVLQAEQYRTGSSVYIADLHEDTAGNGAVGNFEGGDYLMFPQVTIEEGLNTFTVKYAVASPYHNQTIQLRQGSIDGPVLAEVLTENTGGWDRYRETSAPLATARSNGVHDLYIVGVGGDGIGNLDSFTLSSGGSAADNLLAGGGFEEKLSHWEEIVYNVRNKSLTADKKQGSYGYSLTLEAKGGLSLANRSASELAQGLYSAGVWAKSSGSWETLKLQVYKADRLLGEIPLQPADGSPNDRTKWNYYRVESLEAAEGAELTVKVTGQAGDTEAGVLQLDEVSLTRTGDWDGGGEGPPQQPANLLLNPGLEGNNGTGEWTPWAIESAAPYNVGWADGTDGKHSGNYGHTHWSPGPWAVKYAQSIDQAGVGLYRAGVWARTGDAEWNGSLKLKVYQDGQLLGESAAIEGGNYTQYLMEDIPVKGDAPLTVILEGASATSGWLSVDDFELVRTGDAVPSIPVPQSLLANGGFESGTSAWEEVKSPSIYAFQSMNAGEYYGGAAARGYWMNGGADGEVRLSQQVSDVHGGNYRLEGWSRRETFAQEFEEARLQLLAGGVELGSAPLPYGGAWAKTTIENLVIPDGEDVTVVITFKVPGGNAYVTLDDVVLISEDGVPTPPSMTLEAEGYSSQQGLKTAGSLVEDWDSGDWLSYENQFLYAGYPAVTLFYSNSSEAAGAVIEIRADNPVSGTYLGGFTAQYTGGDGVVGQTTIPLRPLDGQHTLYVVMKHGDHSFRLDRMTLTTDNLDRNVLVNPSFEEGDAGWSFTGSVAGWSDSAPDAVYLGSAARNHWMSAPGTVKLEQQVDDMDAGWYKASVWVRGGEGWSASSISVYSGDRLLTQAATDQLTSEYQQLTALVHHVESGPVRVIFTGVAESGNTYLTVDQFELIRLSEDAGLAGLTVGSVKIPAIAAMGEVHIYVSDSVAELPLTIHPADSRVRVKLDDTMLTGGAAYPLALAAGHNRHTITLLAEAGNLSTYDVNFIRQTMETFPVPTPSTGGDSTLPSEDALLPNQQWLAREGDSPGPEVKVKLGPGKQELLIPWPLNEQVLDRKLVVVSDGGRVELAIPPQVLASLMDLELEQGNSHVLRVKVTQKEGQGEGQGKGKGNSLSGIEAELEISMGSRAGDGQRLTLSEFPVPVIVTFAYDADTVDEELLGVYRIRGGQGGSGTAQPRQPSYQGGELDSAASTIAIGLTELGTFRLLAYEVNYSDVPSKHYAHRAIQVLSARHIVKGVTVAAESKTVESGTAESKKSFFPGRKTSRAEFAAMISRMLKLKPSGDALPFTDIPVDSWYRDAVQAAYEAGIVQGKDTARYDPNAEVSRQEMAVMLHRAYSFLSGESEDGNTIAEEGWLPYKDDTELAEWAKEAVAVLQQLGIMRGVGGGKFAPAASATRAQTAQALYLLLSVMQQQGGKQ